MRDRMLQAIAFAGWTVGVPALGAGMFLESSFLAGVGAWSLLAGVVIAALDNVFVVRYAVQTKAVWQEAA
jgi:hypothetical protein